MKLKIHYLNIISSALGKEKEVIEIPEKTSMRDLFGILTERYGEKFSKFLYDPKKQTIKKYAMVIINGEIIRDPNAVLEIPKGGELAIGVMAAGG